MEPAWSESMIKYNVCTNFYSNYLYKGLALYTSLANTSKDFCLWILCMDVATYETLGRMNLKHARLIRLEEVETQQLLKIKKLRTKAEYSWTLKSSFMSYLFRKFNDIPSLFYLDADIFFFKDIKKVYEEADGKNIAIAPHKFPKGFEKREKDAGIFNAGVILIKRDATGLKALEKWKKQCIAWCYRRMENGKFGDQKYLDEWPKLYKALHQFQNPGIDLAPWNLEKYKIFKKGRQIFIDDAPLVFFHFHKFIIYSDFTFEPTFGYYPPKSVVNIVYKPYKKTIRDVIKKVNNANPNFDPQLEQKNIIQYGLREMKRLLLTFRQQ